MLLLIPKLIVDMTAKSIVPAEPLPRPEIALVKDLHVIMDPLTNNDRPLVIPYRFSPSHNKL